MLISTPGIVLHSTPYAESSVVVKMFTRVLGVQSYVVKGVRTARSRTKQNLLQPFSQLDMVVYHSDRTDLHYTKELHPLHTHPDPSPTANALRFFVAEVLYRTLSVGEPMPDLYDYVASLDLATHASQRPILFLLAVCGHLGFAPLNNYAPSLPYFHLEEGRFAPEPEPNALGHDPSLLLHHYLAAHPDPLQPTPPLPLRQALIDGLLAYLHLHLPSASHFQSPDILHQLLS